MCRVTDIKCRTGVPSRRAEQPRFTAIVNETKVFARSFESNLNLRCLLGKSLIALSACS